MFDHRENYYAMGAPLVWLPGALFARITGQLLPGDSSNWYWVLTALYASSLWIVLYLLCLKVCDELQILRTPFSGERRSWRSHGVALILVINLQVIHYAFHRVMMSHVVEVILAFATLLALLKNRFILALFFSAFLTLTRFNDAPVFLLILARYLDVKRSEMGWSSLFAAAKKHILLSLLVLVALTWTFKVAFISGYARFKLSDILIGISSWDVFYFLMGPDWGTLFLIPFWMLGFFLGCIYFRRLSFLSLASLVWMSAEIFICIAWRTNGSDFGQRYLMGATVGLIPVWVECIRFLSERTVQRVKVLAAVNAAWLIFLGVVFVTVDGTFYDNKLFMWDAISTFFSSTFLHHAFFVSPVGVLYETWRGGMDQVLPHLKGFVFDPRREGLILFYVVFSCSISYLVAFLVMNRRDFALEKRTHFE